MREKLPLGASLSGKNPRNSLEHVRPVKNKYVGDAGSTVLTRKRIHAMHRHVHPSNFVHNVLRPSGARKVAPRYFVSAAIPISTTTPLPLWKKMPFHLLPIPTTHSGKIKKCFK